MAVPVATNASLRISNAMSAAERSPPWFPTIPPSPPDTIPAIHAAFLPNRTRSHSLVSPARPASTSTHPKTMPTPPLSTRLWRSAPVMPPAALAIPNRTRRVRSTSCRSRQVRRSAAVKWGMATRTTASLIPYRIATSGVSVLPMPKPATEAMAPAATAAIATSSRKIISLAPGAFRPSPGTEEQPVVPSRSVEAVDAERGPVEPRLDLGEGGGLELLVDLHGEEHRPARVAQAEVVDDLGHRRLGPAQVEPGSLVERRAPGWSDEEQQPALGWGLLIEELQV